MDDQTGTGSTPGQCGTSPSRYHLDPIPRIIPYSGISLLAGAPGLGKTALLATFARAFRDQRPIFEQAVNPVAAIGYVAADRYWANGAGDWLQRAGYPEIRYYSMMDDLNFDPRSLRRKHERTLRLAEFIATLKLPRHSLVFVDPIGLFLGGNLLNYDDCAVACCEIRRMLGQSGLTCIGSAHSIKLKADKRERYMRLQDQILGSTALYGFTDTQMYLASPEETGKPYYTFLWHSHQTKPEFHYLERDEQGLLVPYSGADEGNCTRVLALMEEDVETGFGVLVELAEQIPLSRATLKRVLDVLVERERVVRVRHGVYRKVKLQ